MSAPTIAAACGVSRQSVYGWLSGIMPKTKHLSLLAAYFGVSERWLAMGDGEEERQQLITAISGQLPDLPIDELLLINEILKKFTKSRA